MKLGRLIYELDLRFACLQAARRQVKGTPEERLEQTFRIADDLERGIKSQGDPVLVVPEQQRPV